VLGLRTELERLGVTLVAVGFSPPAGLATLAHHIGWLPPLRFCSDEQRLVYERLGLGRAARGRLFTPGTRAVYAAAAERGVVAERPDEDVRQLGGDALVMAGVARLTFRPSSPDDRPSIDELLAAARSLDAA
jgi:hypothetical protein